MVELRSTVATATTIQDLADWDKAPGILAGATDVEVDPRECGIEYWITHVAQGSLTGLVRGRKAGAEVPAFLREPGPLRDSLISEFAFRSLTEEAATRACALVAASADDVAGLEFYVTQALDEARHAQTFREHLVDLGVPTADVRSTVEANAGADRDRILEPLWEWGIPAFADKFVNGVAIVTILLEGVLAPTTELSERKWKPLSAATTDVERGACVDEIRHLAAGSWFIREHLRRCPQDRRSLVDLLVEGRRLWDDLPTVDVIVKRETLFQEGLEQHRDEIGDYEIFPGRRLVDTSTEERLLMALKWSQEVQTHRLEYMGLSEVIPTPTTGSVKLCP
jgi:hypothetical protein